MMSTSDANNDIMEEQTRHVRLLPYQEPNVERIIDIFTRHKHAIDTSPLGAGKMYMATCVGRRLDFKHVIVVSPKSTLPKWQTMKEMFDLPVAEGHFMTYATLRGSNKNGIVKKHGLLSAKTLSVKKKAIAALDDVAVVDSGSDVDDAGKGDEEEEEEVTVRTVECTERMKTMAEEGCLLIIDEFQHIKNASGQQKAAAELIRCLNQFPTQSKTLFLSGSPVDKATQIITFFRTLGIARQPQLYAKNRYLGRILWRRGAFYEVLMYHAELDADATIQVIEDYAQDERVPYDFIDAMIRDVRRWRPKTDGTDGTYDTGGTAQWYDSNETEATVTMMATDVFHQLMYRLFLHVTKRFHVSFCNDPKEMVEEGAEAVVLHRYNAFYSITGDDAETLAQALSDLTKVVSYDDTNKTVSFSDASGGGGASILQKLTSAMMKVEGAKINKICEIVKQYHIDHPTHKICICVNYKESIKRLCKAFENEKVVVIHGGTTLQMRADAMRAYADDSPRSPYLLIGNTQVLCTGIDLDDKVGNRPRFCIVSPNYSGITLYQLSHRFHRQDSKSDATVHMMYTKGQAYEVRILDALSRKGSIMKGITQEQKNILKYPCDYDDIVMDADDDEADGDSGSAATPLRQRWSIVLSDKEDDDDDVNINKKDDDDNDDDDDDDQEEERAQKKEEVEEPVDIDVPLDTLQII